MNARHISRSRLMSPGVTPNRAIKRLLLQNERMTEMRLRNLERPSVDDAPKSSTTSDDTLVPNNTSSDITKNLSIKKIRLYDSSFLIPKEDLSVEENRAQRVLSVLPWIKLLVMAALPPFLAYIFLSKRVFSGSEKTFSSSETLTTPPSETGCDATSTYRDSQYPVNIESSSLMECLKGTYPSLLILDTDTLQSGFKRPLLDALAFHLYSQSGGSFRTLRLNMMDEANRNILDSAFKSFPPSGAPYALLIIPLGIGESETGIIEIPINHSATFMECIIRNVESRYPRIIFNEKQKEVLLMHTNQLSVISTKFEACFFISRYILGGNHIREDFASPSFIDVALRKCEKFLRGSLDRV